MSFYPDAINFNYPIFMYNIDYQTKAYLCNKTHVDMHTVHDGLADGTAVGLAVGLVGILVGLIVGTLEDGFAVGATAAEVNINRSVRSFPQKNVKNYLIYIQRMVLPRESW